MIAVSVTMNKNIAASARITAKQAIAPDAALDAIATALTTLGIVIPEEATPADYAGLIIDNLEMKEP